MKRIKLILLLITVILTGKGISQTVTNNKVVIDVEIAKKIANDLVSGDVAKAKLKLTEDKILLLEKKVVVKDSVINILEKQKSNLNLVITYKDDIILKQEEISKTYKKELMKSKTKTFFYKIFAYIGVASTGFLLLK
jgi:hypothetical protein